jgi:hypothetical protein
MDRQSDGRPPSQVTFTRDDFGVPALSAANLGLKFLLELAAFAAFAYWGASADDGVVSVLLAIAAPAAAIVLWGIFAAPKSKRRLSDAARVPFELSVFGLAVVALVAAGAPAAAAVFGVLVILNAALLTAWGQWEA